MPANSWIRRIVKLAAYPLTNEWVYGRFQAVAKAVDIWNGTWYEPEIDLIELAVAPGETVLDLGANYGLYTYHLSRRVGPHGRVFAFEPIPFTCRALRTVTRLLRLKNVTVFEKGCGERSGIVAFELPLQDSGAPSAGQAYLKGRNDARPGAEGQVRWRRAITVKSDIVALDAFLPPVTRVSLIKCDIEGAELMALRGAVGIIETHHPTVICEINPWFLEGFGLTLDDLIAFFMERSYRLFRVNDGRLVEIVENDAIDEDNYVFVHIDRLPSFQSLLP